MLNIILVVCRVRVRLLACLRHRIEMSSASYDFAEPCIVFLVYHYRIYNSILSHDMGREGHNEEMRVVFYAEAQGSL